MQGISEKESKGRVQAKSTNETKKVGVHIKMKRYVSVKREQY